MKESKKYCGIDISSEKIDVCYRDKNGKATYLKIDNTRKGFIKLLKTCSENTHFVMESTGVYHMNLVFYLHQKNQQFSVVNVLKIKHYIQMHSQQNKTDRKDAQRIMEYGEANDPETYKMPEKAYFECRSLNQTIHGLTKQITKISNQLHALKKNPFHNKSVEKSLRSIIKKLRNEKKKLNEELQSKLREWEPELLKQVRSVKGIGDRAASELIVYTKGFRGMKNYRQLISYAGLSPVERSSGSSIRHRVRISKQGEKHLRNILYMCALNAKETTIERDENFMIG